MFPLIRPGDVVHMRSPGDVKLRLGDLVAVRGMPDGGLLVHRIVKVRGGTVTIRGDNTTTGNGDFARGDVLAVVAAVERNGREVWFGAGRWGWLVAVAVRSGVVNWCNRAALFVARRRPHRAG
jgi:hypothetical protein